MIRLWRTISVGLWLCVVLGLFVGLGSPVFSASYGVHSHALVEESGTDDLSSHHDTTPDNCALCHSLAGCALVLVTTPDRSLFARLLPPVRIAVLPVRFPLYPADPVYCPSRPRGPPSLSV